MWFEPASLSPPSDPWIFMEIEIDVAGDSNVWTVGDLNFTHQLSKVRLPLWNRDN